MMKALILSVLLVCLLVEMEVSKQASAVCPEPPPVANAFRQWQVTDTGSTVNYTCVDGYQHTAGSLTTFCDASSPGLLHDLPVCTLNCGVPRAIAVTTNNASNDYLADTVVAYTCNADYSMPKLVDNTVRCDTVSAQWEGEHRLILCRADVDLKMAVVSQKPERSFPVEASATLALDNSTNTCSATDDSYSPSWSVVLGNKNLDISVVQVTLKLMSTQSDPAALTIRADVFGGLVENCGKMNMSKVIYSQNNSTLSGMIYCRSNPSKPFGTNVTLSASFVDGTLVGSLHICQVNVKGAPHTASCNFPPRIPRLELVTNGQESFSRLDQMYYVCEDPYTPLYGSGEVTCGLDMQWSAPSLYCTEDEDRVMRTTVTADHPMVHITLDLGGQFEVSGIYSDSKTPVYMTVPGKSCRGAMNTSDTGMYITCQYRPVRSQLVFSVSAPQHSDNTRYKVFGIPYQGGLECLQTDTGAEYKGKLNVTKDGYSCKPWSDPSLSHGFTANDFPDDSLEDAGNFCRNPSLTKSGPWCYVSDADVSWQLCKIYQCDQFCKVKPDGRDYKGSQSYSALGKKCKNWSNSSQPFVRPLDFSDVSTDHRKCRNPGGSQSVPWCFVETPESWLDDDQPLQYEHCDIPDCPISVQNVFIQQSQMSDFDGVSNINSQNVSFIRVCHMTDMWYFTPVSFWNEFVSVACEGVADDLLSDFLNVTALCLTTDSTGNTQWTYFSVLCDGNDMTMSTSTTLLPSTAVMEPDPSSTASSYFTSLQSSTVTGETSSGLTLQPSYSTALDGDPRRYSSTTRVAFWISETTESTLAVVFSSSDEVTEAVTLLSSLTEPSSLGTLESRSMSGIEELTSVNTSISSVAVVSTDSPRTFTLTPASTAMCACHCQFQRKDNSDLKLLTSSIHKELTVSTHNLSRTVRKKTSAADNRQSAVTMGSFGILLLTCTFLLISAGDIMRVLYRAKAGFCC